MKQDETNRMAVLVIALLAGVVAAVLGMLATHHVLYAGLIGGVASFVASVYGARLERGYRASLVERASRHAASVTDQEIMWDVLQNGVPIGRVSDRELAAIQGDVANDGRVWLAQLRNLLTVPVAVFDKLVTVTPVLAFWLTLVYGLCDPNDFIHDAQALGAASPAGLQLALSVLLNLLITTALLTIVIYWLAGGYTFGAANVASEVFFDRVRERLNSTKACGQLALQRLDDGRISKYRPGLLGWLRSRAAARRAERELRI